MSDYIERHCKRCGSPLHHEDDCLDFGLDVPKQTPRCGTCVHHDGERCRKLGPRSAEAAIPRHCWETALYTFRRKDSPPMTVAKAREELLRLINRHVELGRFGVVAITLAVENLIKAAEARGAGRVPDSLAWDAEGWDDPKTNKNRNLK